MFESIFLNTTETTISLLGLLYALGMAIVLGILISLVYMKTQQSQPPTQSFALTLVFLPAVITVIILLVGSNIARAFSLAGAFSIVRFRSAPGNPKDITFVLFSMAVGLSCGMGYLLYGAIVAIVLCFLMIILELIKFGQTKSEEKQLKITIPENLDYNNVFDGIMSKYTENFKLIKVKTADLGSIYELSYLITTKKDVNDKEFIDDLRCRNGNLNITLTMHAKQEEF